ncbi:sigma-70 family RNA polymerase sigma factor [Thalassoglobus sp. JC818]|uniref:RNA polymerase sigma factor n=1 Tax=Thalassoglobus sp. JC818 TaxID=3232136 RepID=UPI00345AA05F
MESANSHLESAITRFRPILLTLAEALIFPTYRGELEASDLVQQTLMEAHRSSNSLGDLDEARFFSWLRTALQRNVLDAIKHVKTLKNDHRRRLRAADIEDSFVQLDNVLIAEDTSPSQVVQKNEQISLMLTAIQSLPESQKKAVILKHLRGFSLREVADALDISESATAGLLHRGRQRLVELIEGGGND